MKFRNLKKWDAPEQCTGLVYFSQLLEEMLFDFSLDTYKPSVMHTGLLCIEALEVVKEIDQGNIKGPNILHVNAEFCANFEKDRVAQALVPLSASSFFPTLKNPKSSLKSIETVLSFLAVHLSILKYKAKNEELLQEEIMGRQSFSEIRRLTRSYITSLIAAGFDQRHIRDVCTSFFCTGKNRITDSSAIESFLSLFPTKNLEFNVIFRVAPIFEHLADALSPLGLAISRTPPNGIDLARYPKFGSASDQQVFASINKIEAKDMHSARNAAEYRLKLSATLLTIFHHKENPDWRLDCIVQSVASNESFQISSPINAMHKCADLLKSVAGTRLKALLSDFSLEKNSFAKFMRSTQLHSMALSSNAYENQILNLWISLESLIPSETKNEDISNIEHIIDSVLPFLNLNYIERLINNLVKDLLRWNRDIAKEILKEVEGKKLTHKLMRLMISDLHAERRAKLITEFGNFHLLRDRFEYLSRVLTEPSNVVSALDAHSIRLGWQIRRIYRTRNIIVHSGRTPAYTKSLIEHAHDYLDAILMLFVKLASNPRSISSVSQGFKYMELRYDSYYKNLKQKNIKFNEENIESLLITK